MSTRPEEEPTRIEESGLIVIDRFAKVSSDYISAAKFAFNKPSDDSLSDVELTKSDVFMSMSAFHEADFFIDSGNELLMLQSIRTVMSSVQNVYEAAKEIAPNNIEPQEEFPPDYCEKMLDALGAIEDTEQIEDNGEIKNSGELIDDSKVDEGSGDEELDANDYINGLLETHREAVQALYEALHESDRITTYYNQRHYDKIRQQRKLDAVYTIGATLAAAAIILFLPKDKK